MEKRYQETGIDQIKAVIGKVQGFQDIHTSEADITEFALLRMEVRVADRSLADIHSDHLQVGIPPGNIDHPSSRATGHVEDALHLFQIMGFWQRSPHGLGHKTILAHQARHLFGRFRINIVAVCAGARLI